jgi:hypothetical protein
MAIPQKSTPKRATKVSYQPKTRVSKPKSTAGGEFIEKESRKDYKGKYIEDFKGKFFAGSSIEENGVELEKVNTGASSGAIAVAVGLLIEAMRGFFKKKPTQSDIEKGTTKRYFVQDKNDNKITETDKDLYQQAKRLLPNTKFAEIDWNIKGPAEDKTINGYPFEGAASKNKKTIQALEKTMPGISTFITDYSLLVVEPVVVQPQDLTSQTFVEQDPDTKLQNDRKANFDTRT